MVNLPIFQVDAFASKAFEGNPAAICPLQEWLDDESLQHIAAENNLSETAFFVPEGDAYKLRWFTPQCEVDLCGHATLASAFVLLNILAPQKSSVEFRTRSGVLAVRKDGDFLAMGLPSMPPQECTEIPGELVQAFSPDSHFVEVLQTRSNYYAVYENEAQIRKARPNFPLLEEIHPFGVCITAPGEQQDFVSRYFAPSYGIPEDPVTGSTHCSLVPYWSRRLNKTELRARQLSQRGGDLWCEFKWEHVILKGYAVLYLKGSISV